MDDRRVHALLPSGASIVRYDRAGKWYLEEADGHRVPLKLPMAVYWGLIARDRGRVFFGVPGGGRFDAEVRRG